MANYYDLITDGGVQPEVDSPTEIQAAMDAAASQRKTLAVPQYRFYSSAQLNIPSNLLIQGAGPQSAIWPVANIVLFKADTVDNWTIDGINSEGFGSLVDNGQGFLRVISCERFRVKNLSLHHFAGTGISQEGGYLNEKKGTYHSIRMDEMFRGMYFHSIGEYCAANMVWVDRSVTCFEIDSGNVQLSLCQGNNSTTGVKLTGGTNNGHGTINASLFNHNEYGLDATDVSLGMAIDGTCFIGGPATGSNATKIRLTNSRNINFTGGMFGANFIVNGGSGTINGQNGVNGAGMITGYSDSAAPALTNGGLLSCKFNTQENGMWAHNN